MHDTNQRFYCNSVSQKLLSGLVRFSTFDAYCCTGNEHGVTAWLTFGGAVLKFALKIMTAQLRHSEESGAAVIEDGATRSFGCRAHSYYLSSILTTANIITIAAQLMCQTYVNENKWSMWDVDALHSTAT